MLLFTCWLMVFIGLVLLVDTKKPKDFPPGPRWLPVVGNLWLVHQLLKIHNYYYLVWHHLSVKFGPVVGLKLGTNKMIIVSGRDAIREFYSNPAFEGRPDGFFFRMRSFDKRLGIVFSDGEFWEVQRKFSMKTLKTLGMGKMNMVEHIEREAHEMVEFYKKKSRDGSLIEMQGAFDISVLNIMWAFLSGKRLDLDDPRLPELHKMIHDGFKVIDMSGGVLNLCPPIRFICPEKSGYLPLLRVLEPLWKFLTNTIDEIKEENLSSETSSFISYFLKEMKVKNRHASFTEEQLLALCLDLFQAGAETSSNTLGFGVTYVLHYPYVISKMRKEMDFVVGKERLPALADRPQLRYTEAVLLEILRLSSVAPLAIVHRALQTTTLGGYVIPENTLALVSLKGLHMDREYWGDPEVFRPERFLDIDGNLIQHEFFLPFGAGKRRCIGENLAKSSVFLFFASFIHAFEIFTPSKQQLPDMEPTDGITLSPKPYKVYLKSRLPYDDII